MLTIFITRKRCLTLALCLLFTIASVTDSKYPRAYKSIISGIFGLFTATYLYFIGLLCSQVSFSTLKSQVNMAFYLWTTESTFLTILFYLDSFSDFTVGFIICLIYCISGSILFIFWTILNLFCFPGKCFQIRIIENWEEAERERLQNSPEVEGEYV